MNAAEARAIADQAAAKKIVIGYLDTIERAAKEGRYRCWFGGGIGGLEERALTLLGFHMTTDTAGNSTVSWADAGAR